jgi:lipopolysaccharide export system protein LptA
MSDGRWTDRPHARRFPIAAVLLLWLWPAGTLLALSSDRDQPLVVNARQIEADEKTGIAVYRGHVTLSQGSLHIEADRLEVRRRDGQTESLLATGNPVRARTRPDNEEADIHLSARRLEYHRPTQYLVLTGNPVLLQGEKRITARCLEYNDLFEQADLYGDVMLDRGEDRLHAAYMHYDVPENFLQAGAHPQGPDGGRVSAVIQPRQPEKPEGTPQP